MRPHATIKCADKQGKFNAISTCSFDVLIFGWFPYDVNIFHNARWCSTVSVDSWDVRGFSVFCSCRCLRTDLWMSYNFCWVLIISCACAPAFAVERFSTCRLRLFTFSHAEFQRCADASVAIATSTFGLVIRCFNSNIEIWSLSFLLIGIG